MRPYVWVRDIHGQNGRVGRSFKKQHGMRLATPFFFLLKNDQIMSSITFDTYHRLDPWAPSLDHHHCQNHCHCVHHHSRNGGCHQHHRCRPIGHHHRPQHRCHHSNCPQLGREQQLQAGPILPLFRFSQSASIRQTNERKHTRHDIAWVVWRYMWGSK